MAGTILFGNLLVDKVTVTVMSVDENNHILFAKGTTVPTDGTTGFAKGCLFIKTDATGAGLYVNNGTPTSCLFKLVTTS